MQISNIWVIRNESVKELIINNRVIMSINPGADPLNLIERLAHSLGEHANVYVKISDEAPPQNSFEE